jgi:regulator of sigma E protease
VSYVLAFLGFVALIVLHEAGHFVAAKAVGMRVERFSLFFGPMPFKRRIGETEYGVGIVPLGGYVKITGMSPDEEIPPEVTPRAYYNQPVWKRIVVIAAGPAVNLLLAFVILWALFLGTGQTVTGAHGQAVVSDTVAGIVHPSAAAGVLALGDRIVSVDGVKGDSQVLRNVIGRDRCAGGAQTNNCRATQPVTIVVERDGRLVTLHVTPRYSAAAKRMLVGFDFGLETKPANVLEAASLSVTGMWNVTKRTVSAFARLFQAKERRQLQGVVGAYAYTQEAIQQSPSLALQVLALISLSLGVINLFPFLPLDGGHIFWAVAEKLRGRRIPFDVMERAGFVGFALILVLFVIGMSNSISTLTGSGFGIH